MITFLVLGALLALLAVWLVPKWQVRRIENLKDRIQLETEARKTLATILGGAALLAGLYFTSQELRIRREAQLTEQFYRAVAQLSDEKVETRVLAIYSLEQVAKESEKYHWRIMALVTAYLRENAPRKRGVEELKIYQAPKLAADTQAMITLLGRRTLKYEKGDNRSHDLRNVDIAGAYLAGAHLERVNLQGANLQYVNRGKGPLLHDPYLDPVHLTGANLYGAVLRQANLNGSNLEEANLWGADLLGISLKGANLEKADLQHGNLLNAELQEANLRNANLVEAKLNGANLMRANLRRAQLWQAKLKNANLRRAQLQQANLTSVNLEGARLVGANLTNANFQGADIRKADLRNSIGLTKEQIESVKSKEETKLPDPTVKIPLEFEDNPEYTTIVVYDPNTKQIALKATSALTIAEFEASAVPLEDWTNKDWELRALRTEGSLLLLADSIPHEKVTLVREILSPIVKDKDLPVWTKIVSDRRWTERYAENTMYIFLL